MTNIGTDPTNKRHQCQNYISNIIENNCPLYKVSQTYDNEGGNRQSLVHNNWPSTGHQESDHVFGGFLNEALRASADLPTQTERIEFEGFGLKLG